MRAIGFRATPTDIHYAVVEGDPGAYDVVALDAVRVPAALLPPNQLHFLRTVLLDVMEEYQVTRAGLRTAETTARAPSVFRYNVEGVVQELLASSTVDWYFAGAKARIASLLGYADRKTVTKFCDGDDAPPVATEWAQHSKEQREAILAACAAVNGGNPNGAAAGSTLAGVGGKA